MSRVLVLVVTLFGVAKALDCGIHMIRNDDVKEAITKCVPLNKTLEDLWDMTDPSESDSSSSSTSEEDAIGENNSTRKMNETKQIDGKMMMNFQSHRKRRASLTETEEKSTGGNSGENSTSMEAVDENCLVQCVFQNLNLTDSNGYPEHSKLLNSLLKNALSRELRDFLQDSADDCFQEMDKESQQDSCVYSSKVLACMAERGRANCADWPVGNIPFH